MNPLMKGLIVGKAVLPGYDTGPPVAHLCATMEAGLAGPPAGSGAEDGR